MFTKVGIRELNVTVIYRKRLKPNELDSRLRGNDGFLLLIFLLLRE